MGAAPQYVAWASNLGVSHTLNVHFAVKSSGCIIKAHGGFHGILGRNYMYENGFQQETN